MGASNLMSVTLIVTGTLFRLSQLLVGFSWMLCPPPRLHHTAWGMGARGKWRKVCRTLIMFMRILCEHCRSMLTVVSHSGWEQREFANMWSHRGQFACWFCRILYANKSWVWYKYVRVVISYNRLSYWVSTWTEWVLWHGWSLQHNVFYGIVQ